MDKETPEDQPVEADPPMFWVKSSLSYHNGNCVEIANLPQGIAMRDSKDASGPILRFTGTEWQAFLEGARNGEFDRFGSV